jgi:hypothetical protein
MWGLGFSRGKSILDKFDILWIKPEHSNAAM